MAIFEKTIQNKKFDQLLWKLENEIPASSWSAELEAGSDLKIGAQGGVLLQPEFIVAFQPGDFAVLKSEIPHGAYHGIIIRHGNHTVILGQAFFQLVRDLVIAGIANAQHIYPVVLEPVTKIPVGFGELRRNKNKVQNILSSLKGAPEKPKPSPVSTNAAEFCVCGRVTICVGQQRTIPA